MANVAASISTKIGVAPVKATQLAVAANVKEGTMTSSPRPIPRATITKCCADVPELTAMDSSPSTARAENSCSKAVTSGP